MGQVRKRIIAVRVDHQGEFGETVAHGPDPLDVLSLPDLHLDPVVTLGRGPFDGGQEIGLGILEANAQARHDHLGGEAQELVQGDPPLEGEQDEEARPGPETEA